MNLLDIEFVCMYVYLIKVYFKKNPHFLIYAGHIFMWNSPQIDFLDHPNPYAHFRFPFQTFLLDHHVFVQNWLLVLAFLFF